MASSRPSYLWRIRTLCQEGSITDDWISKNDWFVEDHEDIDRFEVSIICGWSNE